MKKINLLAVAPILAWWCLCGTLLGPGAAQAAPAVKDAHAGHGQEEARNSKVEKDTHENHGQEQAEAGHSESEKDAHAGHTGAVELPVEQQRVIGLTLVKVEKKPLAEVLELSGTIPEEPSDLVSAAPSEPCKLVSFFVEVGQRVSKNQALAWGKTDSNASVTIRANRSGTVLALPRRPGEITDVYSPAALLADLGTLMLSLSASPEDASNLRVGQKIEAFHLSNRSDMHSGRITAVSPRVDPESRLVRVAAKVNNSNNHLRLGMFLTAKVYMQTGKPVLSLPEEAVLRVKNADTVYLKDAKDPDAFLPTAVRTGEKKGGRVEILSGLKEGDSVAAQGAFYLKSEQMKGVPGGDGHGH